jgi:glycine cleavage system H protein
MTVLLVVLTIAVFLTIDYVKTRKKIPHVQAAITPPTLAPDAVPTEVVSGFQLRPNLRYHPGHTWALRESPTLVRVGIDDFAARLMGKVDGIVLPKPGQWVRQGQKIFAVLRSGSKAELVSPVEGEITQVNEQVAQKPEVLTTNPYGEGWLMNVVSPDAETNFRNLLGGNLARHWLAEAASRIHSKIPAPAGAVAQDGGLAVPDLSAQLPNQEWASLAREFFLT